MMLAAKQASKRKKKQNDGCLKTAKFKGVYLYLARVHFCLQPQLQKKKKYFDGQEI